MTVAESEPPFPAMSPTDVDELAEEEVEMQNQWKQEGADALEDGEFELALEKFTAAISLGHATALMYSRRAQILLRLQRPRAAINDCSAALDINPDSGKAFKIRARAHVLLEQWAEAHSDFQEGLKIDYDEVAYEESQAAEAKMKEMQAAEAPASGPVAVPVGQIWEIVGGADKGGVLVREGLELNSAQSASRLATGTMVEELELRGERLHFRRITGSGPDEGWISIALKDKVLACRVASDAGNLDQAKLQAGPEEPPFPAMSPPDVVELSEEEQDKQSLAKQQAAAADVEAAPPAEVGLPEGQDPAAEATEEDAEAKALPIAVDDPYPPPEAVALADAAQSVEPLRRARRKPLPAPRKLQGISWHGRQEEQHTSAQAKIYIDELDLPPLHGPASSTCGREVFCSWEPGQLKNLDFEPTLRCWDAQDFFYLEEPGGRAKEKAYVRFGDHRQAKSFIEANPFKDVGLVVRWSEAERAAQDEDVAALMPFAFCDSRLAELAAECQVESLAVGDKAERLHWVTTCKAEKLQRVRAGLSRLACMQATSTLSAARPLSPARTPSPMAAAASAAARKPMEPTAVANPEVRLQEHRPRGDVDELDQHFFGREEPRGKRQRRGDDDRRDGRRDDEAGPPRSREQRPRDRDERPAPHPRGVQRARNALNPEHCAPTHGLDRSRERGRRAQASVPPPRSRSPRPEAAKPLPRPVPLAVRKEAL